MDQEARANGTEDAPSARRLGQSCLWLRVSAESRRERLSVTAKSRDFEKRLAVMDVLVKKQNSILDALAAIWQYSIDGQRL